LLESSVVASEDDEPASVDAASAVASLPVRLIEVEEPPHPTATIAARTPTA
jgi:hypothetical protein